MLLKKYKKISKLAKHLGFSNFELITNYGLFSGDTNLFKVLKIIEIIETIKKVPGDIIEFGVWHGNTSILIKKILDIKKIKKRVYLFDHFEGLKHYSKKDPKISFDYKNSYKSNKIRIKKIIDFFKFENIKIIDKDATKISKKDFKKSQFCLVILDMDLYLPTKKILDTIEKCIPNKGIILFDEANKDLWKGEKKAMTEFFQAHRTKYKKEIISEKYQPDVMLTKIKK